MKFHDLHFSIDALGDGDEALPDGGEADGRFMTDPGKKFRKHEEVCPITPIM
jgi:hypothetical protein